MCARTASVAVCSAPAIARAVLQRDSGIDARRLAVATLDDVFSHRPPTPGGDLAAVQVLRGEAAPAALVIQLVELVPEMPSGGGSRATAAKRSRTHRRAMRRALAFHQVAVSVQSPRVVAANRTRRQPSDHRNDWNRHGPIEHLLFTACLCRPADASAQRLGPCGATLASSTPGLHQWRRELLAGQPARLGTGRCEPASYNRGWFVGGCEFAR